MHISLRDRKTQTIQTQNAVSVVANGSSVPSTGGPTNNGWQSSKGFDQVAVTMTNDAAINSGCAVYWSNDGVNAHGNETIIATAAQVNKAGRTGVKADWFKVVPINGDASLAHTMSAWAYLIS